MDSSGRELNPARGRLWWITALLVLLNLAFMAVDALVLPAQGLREMVPLKSPPEEARLPRRSNQFDFLMRNFGIRPVDLEKPQPGVRPPLVDPRTRLPALPQPQPSLRPFSLHVPGWGGLAMHVVGLLALLSTCTILVFFLPDRFRVMRDALGGSWAHKLRTLAIGLIGYLAALLLAFLLAIVVSGLPYSILAMVVLTAITAVGITAVSLALGKWLASMVGATAPPLAQLILGILVAFPATVLPSYIGWGAAALLAFFGMGVILLTRLGSSRPWSLKALQN